MIRIRLPELAIQDNRLISTSWKISRYGRFTDHIVFKSDNDSTNTTEISVNLPMDRDQTYSLIYKFHFEDGSDSAWSRAILITKNSNGFIPTGIIIETPILEIIPDEDSVPLESFTVKSSDFKLYSGQAAHLATTWVIKDIDDNIVLQRVMSRDNLTHLRIPKGVLEPLSMYTITATYVSDNNVYSREGTLVINTIDDSSSSLLKGDAIMNEELEIILLNLTRQVFDLESMIVKTEEIPSSEDF